MGLITIIKILDCPLIILSSAELPMNLGNIERMSLREKEIFGNDENQTRGWEAQMLPLCYANPHPPHPTQLTTFLPTLVEAELSQTSKMKTLKENILNAIKQLHFHEL